MPSQAEMPIYNKPDAEKAWTKLVALCKTGCVQQQVSWKEAVEKGVSTLVGWAVPMI